MTLLASLRRTLAPRDAGWAPALRRALKPRDVERLAFPGQREAALEIEATKGYRAELRRISFGEQTLPAWRASLGEAMAIEPAAVPAHLRGVLAAASRWLPLSRPIAPLQQGGVLEVRAEDAGDAIHLLLYGPVLRDLGDRELSAAVGGALGRYLLGEAPGAPFRDPSRVAGAWEQLGFHGDNEPRRLRAGRFLVACDLSADRFAMLLAGGLDPFLRYLLQTSTESGELPGYFDPLAYRKQVREALSLGLSFWARSARSASNALRAHAADLFSRTAEYRALTGQGRGSLSLAEVNQRVARLLAGWVPRGADHIDQPAFERFLLAAGLAIAAADGRFSQEERSFIARALPGVQLAASSSEAAAELARCADQIRRTGDDRARASTLRFLCGLVDADGQASPAELAAIDMLGGALGARGLFRKELLRRYFFDPKRLPDPPDDEPEDDSLPFSPSLRRYLQTVLRAGPRVTTARRILHLGGFRRRTPAVVARIEAILAAWNLRSSPSIGKADLDQRLRLRVGKR